MLTGKIQRINTILYCRNWKATIRFYRDTLKFSVHHEREWFVEFHLTGSTYLSIADASLASIKSAGGDGITLSWQVEDIDLAFGWLHELGVKTSPIKPIWGARSFYFYDPEGHRIEVWA
ncbi:MAG: VOC family protein [Desulfobacterales bacterium]|nr:MAG: VOC family protein [Desulfobacterales bacterium]